MTAGYVMATRWSAGSNVGHAVAADSVRWNARGACGATCLTVAVCAGEPVGFSQAQRPCKRCERNIKNVALSEGEEAPEEAR